MIQFNLLPDVKVQFIKTQRLKRIIVIVAVLASALSVVILLFSISFSALQGRHLTNLDKDIARISSELKSNPDLTKILSVQNQLNTLPALYNGRPAVDRLPGYLDQTTPNELGMGRLSIDFTTSTVEVAGLAPTLEIVNSYVDTLKFTTFKTTEEGSVAANAFKDVVLTRFGKDSTGASFVISFTFDPLIFDITKDITLSVPNLVTTRTQVSPTELFNGVDNGGDAQTEEVPNGEE